MEMIETFHREYDKILSNYDAFVVTHTPVFAMIFEKYGKPIIVVNSCRYDQPFCWNKNTEMKEKFHESLRRMEARHQLVLVSNNLADRVYLKEHTGLDSTHIPSLCLYTKATYNPELPQFVIFDGGVKNQLKSIPNSDLLVERPGNFKYTDLFKYRGIVHMPYDISSMSLFEQYFAKMPLFFPTKEFLKSLIKGGQVTFKVRYDKWGEVLSDDEIEKWLINADYYNFKYIQYYSSFDNCVKMVNEFNDTDRVAREAHIESVKKDTLDKWKSILDKRLFPK